MRTRPAASGEPGSGALVAHTQLAAAAAADVTATWSLPSTSRTQRAAVRRGSLHLDPLDGVPKTRARGVGVPCSGAVPRRMLWRRGLNAGTSHMLPLLVASRDGGDPNSIRIRTTQSSGDPALKPNTNRTEQGSEEEGNKDMDAFSAVMDKVKNHPDVMEKVSAVMDKVKSHPEMVEKGKDEVKSIADALHLRRYGSKDKEPESEEKAEEGEAEQNVDEGASADKTDEEPNVLEQAVEEIQAVAAALQQQTAPAAETETETGTEIPVEAAPAAAETSAEGDKPEEADREVEKDDPKKRLDFAGFFAMLFERFCSPGNKK